MTGARAGHGLPGAAGGRLVALAPGSAGRPLFAFHAVGGTVHPFAHLAAALAPDHRVHAVEAAGLRPGSGCAADLDAMVSDYADLVRGAWPRGPYELAGWSMGGPVAFEVGRRLQELGEQVQLLVLLDAPCRLAARPRRTDEELAARFVADASRTLGLDPAGRPPEPAAAGDRLAWLAGRLDAGAGSGPAIRAEIGRRFEVFKANARAIAGYRPAGTLRAAALVVTAESSPDSTPDWRTAVDGPVQTLRVPGDHWALLRPPVVRRVAEAVLGCRPAGAGPSRGGGER